MFCIYISELTTTCENYECSLQLHRHIKWAINHTDNKKTRSLIFQNNKTNNYKSASSYSLVKNNQAMETLAHTPPMFIGRKNIPNKYRKN